MDGQDEQEQEDAAQHLYDKEEEEDVLNDGGPEKDLEHQSLRGGEEEDGDASNNSSADALVGGGGELDLPTEDMLVSPGAPVPADATQMLAWFNLAARPTPKHVYVLPLSLSPVFAGTYVPILVSEQFLSRLQAVKTKENPFVGLFLHKNATEEGWEEGSDAGDALHHVGTLGCILVAEQYSSHPAMFQLKVAAVSPNRLHIKNVRRDPKSGLFKAEVEEAPLAEDVEPDEEIRANSASIEAQLLALTQKEETPLFHQILEEAEVMASQLNHEEEEGDGDYSKLMRMAYHSFLCDMAGVAIGGDPLEQQRVLEASSLGARQKLVLDMLSRRVALHRAREDSRPMEDAKHAEQKQHYLRQRMEEIKAELGPQGDTDALDKKFREALEGKTIPKETEKVIEEELSKLSSLDKASSEYNVTRTYLEWLCNLPWGRYTSDRLELDHASAALDKDHYGLERVKEQVLEFIAVGKLRGSVQGKILCLVGPPGVGKTSIGRSIADALDREFFRFSVGGLGDVAEIKGHRRTYVGARPGKLVQALRSGGSSNPVVLIDEVDKLGSSTRGDPAAALLEVLDPSQNESFLDHYLDVPYDLSQVLFVCTANSLDPIPKPLLDRMEVLNLSGYALQEKLSIAQAHLAPRAMKDAGLPQGACTLTPPALTAMVEQYCREAGVRSLQKAVERVVRKVALRRVRGDESEVVVAPENLVELLGQPRFSSDRFYPHTPVGVVMGLAWTPMGGSTLYIESSTDGEHGRDGADEPALKSTGQMGDVMQESTRIAYTFAKNYLARHHPHADLLAGARVHMHIPEGATRKDGPSAGAAMVTSLLSLALDKPCTRDVAMTGELSLTGKVLPIGGVKEKTLAARRSGAKTLIFPRGNQRDWDEMDQHIKDGLNVHFVDHYDEIFPIVLGDDDESSAKE